MFDTWPRDWWRRIGSDHFKEALRTGDDAQLDSGEREIVGHVRAYLRNAADQGTALKIIEAGQIEAARRYVIRNIADTITECAMQFPIELVGGRELDLFEPEDGRAFRAVERLVDLLLRRSDVRAWAECGERGRLRFFELANLISLNRLNPRDAKQADEVLEHAKAVRRRLAALGPAPRPHRRQSLAPQPRPDAGHPRDPAAPYADHLVRVLHRWLVMETARRGKLSGIHATDLAHRIAAALRRRASKHWIPLLPTPSALIAPLLVNRTASRECAAEIFGLVTTGSADAGRQVRRWIKEQPILDQRGAEDAAEFERQQREEKQRRRQEISRRLQVRRDRIKG